MESLYRLAVTDALTGLYNRHLLEEALERELAAARRHGRRLALALIDLDHFKRLNDGAGHAGGDRVLVDVARVLRTCCRRSDVVARTGGDEFMVLMVSADAASAGALAWRLLRDLRALPCPLPGGQIGASIGIALAPSRARRAR